MNRFPPAVGNKKPVQLPRTGFLAVALAGFVRRPQAELQIGANGKLR
jgi:hypothetical protein